MHKAIRFIHPWRGRKAGETNTTLDYGVMAELVRTRRAEWYQPETSTPRATGKKKRSRA